MKEMECVRQVSNWSSVCVSDRFENHSFDPVKFKQKMVINSPRMVTLFENIYKLDEKDFKKHGKLFKHYIYTDLKKSHGVKLLISAMISAGYNFCYKRDGKIKIKENSDENFLVLSSSILYNKPFGSKKSKKHLKFSMSVLEIFTGKKYDLLF